MTATTAALVAAIGHANLVSCQHWIACSARVFEQTHQAMQVALEAFVECPLAALSAATVQVAAATTRSVVQPEFAGPWTGGASYFERLRMSCLVAEYANDMDPSSAVTDRPSPSALPRQQASR